MSDLCPGTNCPIKESCYRYREKIDEKKENHYAYAPYDHKKQKCGWYIGVFSNEIIKEVTEILNIQRDG